MSLIRHRRRIFLLCKETGIQNGQECLWKLHGICEPFCNDDTNERRLRLLEFATFNDLVLANTLGHHKASWRLTWHSPNGQHHNRTDYILVRKRIRSIVNIVRTRSFPGADTGSDHDLLMVTFRLRKALSRHWQGWKQFGLTRVFLSAPRYDWCAPLLHPSFCMLVNHGHSQQSSKEEYKPWKWGATARYYTSHTKTMLPTSKSVPRSSRQLNHRKTSWRS